MLSKKSIELMSAGTLAAVMTWPIAGCAAATSTVAVPAHSTFSENPHGRFATALWALTPQPLLWPSPPSRTDGRSSKKALRFHDLRTLQRTRLRAALAAPVG